MESAAQSWLAVQCEAVPETAGGAVFLGPLDRGPYAPVASWPAGARPAPPLAEAAQLAMSERRGVVLAPDDCADAQPEHDAVAVPFFVDDRLAGSVAVLVPHRPKAQQLHVTRLLERGCAWLAFLLGREARVGRERLAALIELVAAALEHERFQAAATAVTSELATRLGLERVGLGFRRKGRSQLRALSHSARFDSRTQLVRALEAAMDEALDQGEPIRHPPPAGAPPRLARAHEALVREHGAGEVATLPLADADRLVGALTLEAGAGRRLDDGALELCAHVASLLGPILELRRRDDRSLAAKAAEAARAGLERLVGPGHLALKLGVSLASALLLVSLLWKAEYRVTADATLEGTVQRVVVAGVAGFVVEAHARAGDVVREGELLAALDDRDLALEQLKWTRQREQTHKEYREALATHDRTQVAILGARIAQADAELALVDAQLARTRLVAPFDGIVVKGDLSQSLGSPVERGDVLFEVAPLDSYRIILEVDERQVADVAPGQHGRLALSSLPRERLPFVIERITPVASAAEGRNTFRVEARLDEPSAALRPGMEGVAKIEVARRPLLWIGTHALVDGLRLRLWSWWL